MAKNKVGGSASASKKNGRRSYTVDLSLASPGTQYGMGARKDNGYKSISASVRRGGFTLSAAKGKHHKSVRVGYTKRFK